MMDRSTAEAYASWFRCLADPTRLQLLRVLAEAPEPMSIGELVDSVGVGQSTVSGHVQRLAASEFVFVERLGTSALVRINADCLTALPEAANTIMARDRGARQHAVVPAARSGGS